VRDFLSDHANAKDRKWISADVMIEKTWLPIEVR